MKTSYARVSMFKVIVGLSCLTAGVDAGFAQQTQYAPTYYQPQQPSAMERIRSTGQNVGSFIRRKFYGESAPTSYPQQPVYQRPGSSQAGAYQAQSYNLDAPARPVEQSGGTGFQQPAPGTLPKYVTPPTSTPSESTTSTKAAPKTKSSPPPVVAPAPAPTASKKRYTPAKPSTFTKPATKSKPAPVTKRVVDEPPSTPTPPTLPEPPKYEDTPPQEPTTEAKLNKEIYPLPGSPQPEPTTGSAEPDPAPKSDLPAPTTGKTETTNDAGEKSSGSFLVGKKTSKAGRVVSPHAPFNELDITGLPSGSLALDPTTQKVFEVP